MLLLVAMLSRGPFSLVLGSLLGTAGGGATAVGAVVAVGLGAVVAAAAATGTAAAGEISGYRHANK